MSDQDILAILGGLIEMQRTARSGVPLCAETGLIFLRIYYQKLPESVARRLTEIHPDVVARIPRATSPQGSQGDRRTIAASVASAAAFAQAVRAANSYRRRLGLALLGADGRLERGEDDSGEQAGRICPICGRRYTERPALSRADNTTDICPECGMMEALTSIPQGHKGAKEG